MLGAMQCRARLLACTLASERMQTAAICTGLSGRAAGDGPGAQLDILANFFIAVHEDGVYIDDIRKV
jgi:hypothetical protein